MGWVILVIIILYIIYSVSNSSNSSKRNNYYSNSYSSYDYTNAQKDDTNMRRWSLSRLNEEYFKVHTECPALDPLVRRAYEKGDITSGKRGAGYFFDCLDDKDKRTVLIIALSILNKRKREALEVKVHEEHYMTSPQKRYVHRYPKHKPEDMIKITVPEYNQDGYDKDGYDINGYDRDGYDRKGFSRSVQTMDDEDYFSSNSKNNNKSKKLVGRAAVKIKQ